MELVRGTSKEIEGDGETKGSAMGEKGDEIDVAVVVSVFCSTQQENWKYKELRSVQSSAAY